MKQGKKDSKDQIKIIFEGLDSVPVNVDLNITFVDRKPVENLRKALRLKHQKNHEGKS